MVAVISGLLIQGFLSSVRLARLPEYRAKAIDWIRSGQLKFKDDVVEGLENAPDAYIGPFKGRTSAS